MEFTKLTQAVVQNAYNYGEKYNIVIDEDFALVKLMEEMGELAQAKLIYDKKSRPEKFLDPDTSKQNIACELADIMGMSMLLADLLDIDLQQALQKKWIGKE